jgi:prefoldin subunit 5
MTYQINNTAGTLIATIPDGTLDTSTSLTLVGRKYSGYGEILQENLVKILENFSNTIAPENPINGQLWYNSSNDTLSYYDGSWQALANVQQLTSNISTLSNTLTNALTSNVNAINANISSINANVTAANAAIASLNSLKAPLASPALTGTPTAPTAAHLTANTQIASTQFVQMELAYYATDSDLTSNVADLITRFDANISSNVNAINANISSINANVTAANAAIASLNSLKAPLASPALTGTPTAPTANISVNSAQLATTAYVHNILPIGMILQWYGDIASIPYGYALCNGQTVAGHTTPNLTDRFVVAAGPQRPAGSTGGNNTLTPTMQAAGQHSHGANTGSTILAAEHLPTHNHSVTVTGATGSHSHNFTDVYAIVGDYELGSSTASPYDRNNNYIYPSFYAGNATDWDYDNGSYGFPSRTDPASASLSINVSETSVGQSHGHTHSMMPDGTHTHPMNSAEIVPPYYALCYIMKVV